MVYGVEMSEDISLKAQDPYEPTDVKWTTFKPANPLAAIIRGASAKVVFYDCDGKGYTISKFINDCDLPELFQFTIAATTLMMSSKMQEFNLVQLSEEFGVRHLLEPVDAK